MNKHAAVLTHQMMILIFCSPCILVQFILYFQLDTLLFCLRTISAILFPLHVSGLTYPSSGGLNCTCSLWYFPPENGIVYRHYINHLNPELNPICYFLALLGAHHFLHVSRIRVKFLTLRRLMSYVYMEHPFLMFLDHTQ